MSVLLTLLVLLVLVLAAHAREGPAHYGEMGRYGVPPLSLGCGCVFSRIRWQSVDGAAFVSGLLRPYCCVVGVLKRRCRCLGAVWSVRLNVDG